MANFFNKKPGKKGSEVKPEKAKKVPQIRVAKSAYYQQIASKTFRGLVMLLGVLVVIYICFAATIVRVIPTVEGNFVPVKNSTFPGGIATPETEMVVSMSTEQGDSTLDLLKQSFMLAPDLATVKVVAGPSGDLNWAETGLIAVNGEVAPVRVMTPPDNRYLAHEYIVECISGACNPGEGYIIGEDQVYGEPFKLRN